MSPGTTPSQTVGPFFSLGLAWADGPHVVGEAAEGAIRLGGRVLDGAGDGVPDALVETWQADRDGRLGAPGFRGFGRCPTAADGTWAVRTVKPGSAEPGHAPHVAVSVFARGLLRRVVTRIYFPDEAANAADPVLAALDADAQATLVATAVDGGYAFDIRLQGPGETAFFAV